MKTLGIILVGVILGGCAGTTAQESLVKWYTEQYRECLNGKGFHADPEWLKLKGKTLQESCLDEYNSDMTQVNHAAVEGSRAFGPAFYPVIQMNR